MTNWIKRLRPAIYMNRQALFLLLSTVLIFSQSCHRHRLVHSAPTTQPVIKPDTTLAKRQPSDTTLTPSKPVPVRPGIEEARANVAEIDFIYLTAKSKLSFKSKDQDIENATVFLRVRKDSLIWLSVRKIGIEAVRALISRDSIVILNTFQKEYSVYDFPTISKQFNFAMNFDLLQALIVGNLPLPRRPAQKIKNERDYLLLRQSEGKVLVENYIGEQDRKLKKLMVTEQPTENTLRLDYEDFSMLNNFLFPYTSLVTLDYKSKTDGQFYQTLLKIQHNKVELVDKSPGFPFSIPAKYQRRP